MNRTDEIEPFIVEKLNIYGAGILDPRHHGFTKKEKYEIMHMKYQNEFIADALETGHFVQTKNGDIKIGIRTLNQDISIIAGYIFEALTVRLANSEEENFGHGIFKWCTMRTRLSKQFFEKFQAIGIGFPNSNVGYPVQSEDRFRCAFLN